MQDKVLGIFKLVNCQARVLVLVHGPAQIQNSWSKNPLPQIRNGNYQNDFCLNISEYFPINKSQGPKLQSSKALKIPRSQALKPFYSSKKNLNLSLTLKQLLLVLKFTNLD